MYSTQLAIIILSCSFVSCAINGGSLEVISSNGETERYDITLGAIVCFATGMSEVPPLGFSPKPAIVFQSESILPMSNTCSNLLKLPLKSQTYEYNMTFGFVNTAGFGKV